MIERIPMTLNLDAFYESKHGKRPFSKRLLLDVLRELISNAHDAIIDRKDLEGFIPLIAVRFDRKKQILEVVDNGIGLTKKNRQGLAKFYDSIKQHEKYTGQFGTGRATTLHIADRVHFASKTREHPGGIHYTMDHDAMRNLTKQAHVTADFHEGIPAWCEWPLVKKETGTVVRIELPVATWQNMKDHTDALLKELGSFFQPSVSNMITVNGKKLKKRAVVDDIVVEGSKEVPELGGLVTWEFVMPKTWEQETDAVWLAGKNRICKLNELAEGLHDDELMNAIPDLLRDQRKVSGNIFFPILNKHVGEDRESLKPSVFQGTHAAIVQFLAESIGPELDAAYRKKEMQDAKNRKRRALLEFADELPEIDAPETREGPDVEEKDEDIMTKPPAPPPPLKVNQMSVTLMPGDPYAFRVVRHKSIDADDLRWDASNAGGTISNTEGPTTLYEAGSKLGNFSLILFNAKDSAQTLTITIAIVPKPLLYICPKSCRLEQGDMHTFTLRSSSEQDFGNVQWEVQTEDGGRAIGIRLSDKTNVSVTVEANDNALLGNKKLIAHLKQNQVVETIFKVVEAEMGPSIVLNGKRYFLTAAMTKGALVHFKIELQRGSTKKKYRKIEIDLDHPDYVAMDAKKDKAALRQFLLNRILVGYARFATELGELDGRKVLEEIERLSSAFVQAKGTPEKKNG